MLFQIYPGHIVAGAWITAENNRLRVPLDFSTQPVVLSKLCMTDRRTKR
jgi:hypothetical protein